VFASEPLEAFFRSTFSIRHPTPSAWLTTSRVRRSLQRLGGGTHSAVPAHHNGTTRNPMTHWDRNGQRSSSALVRDVRAGARRIHDATCRPGRHCAPSSDAGGERPSARATGAVAPPA